MRQLKTFIVILGMGTLMISLSACSRKINEVVRGNSLIENRGEQAVPSGNAFARKSGSADWLEASGYHIVNIVTGQPYFLRGVNLGYWLEQEGYMMNPQNPNLVPNEWKMKRKYFQAGKTESEIESFYQDWRNNFIQKADIDYIASLGFNCIRLPLHYELFLTPSQRSVRDAVAFAANSTDRGIKHDRYKDSLQRWYDDDELFNDPSLAGFEVIDNLLSWCADNDMYVILDLHCAPGGQGTDANITDNFYPNNLWDFSVFRDVTTRLWKRISQRYLDEPRIAFYDLINEPHHVPGGGQTIHDLYQRLITTIRNNGDNHMLMVEGNGYGNNYDYLEPFTFSPNWGLIYNAHRYGINPSDDYVSDPNPNQINRLVNILNFRSQYNVPVFVGETGENSNAWMSQNIQKLEDNDIGWAHWTYKRHDVGENAALMRIGGYYPTDGAGVMSNVLGSIKFQNCIANSNTIQAITENFIPHDPLPIGETVWLKGVNGKYVSSENGQSPMTCNRDQPQAWETFTVVDAGDGKIALKSMGKYVSSENGASPITCNRSEIQDWEKFELVENENGTISLKGNNGKYISSENGTQSMTCNKDQIGAWEQFTMVTTDDSESGGEWHEANLTHFTSYPDPNSEECIKYNGCKWAGMFAFVEDQKSEEWVSNHNIIAVHSRDAGQYALKTFEIKKGDKTIQAKVYDECADADCDGCCTVNADANGVGFLIDMEKYTVARFGADDGIVEWRCLDCEN